MALGEHWQRIALELVDEHDPCAHRADRPKSLVDLVVENVSLRAGQWRLEQELLAATDCKHRDRYSGFASAMCLAATRVQALVALTRGPPATSIDMRGMRSRRSAIRAI